MTDPAADTRRAAYQLLTAVAVFVCVAKVVGAENVFEPSRYRPATAAGYGADFPDPPTRDWPKVRPEPTPWFSSNDKARWATVRALVDEGTYVIGRRENFRESVGYTDTGIVFEDGYQTLDKVMNPDTGEFFSSKPPLFPTLLANEYWLLKKTLGWSIVRDRWLVVCTILLTVNVLPFAVYLVLLARLVEQYGTTDFGRVFTFATAALGTFLVTFSGTLNNHTPAACCVLFAVYPLLRGSAESWRSLATSGFFAGLTVTFELPAAALAAGLFLPLLVARPRKALAYFLPAFLVPLLALFVCNYAALGKLLPAYSDFGGPWYEFPGSHWLKLKEAVRPRGIDFADEPKSVYLFHLTFGHHGWFSLTPVWLLGLGGLVGAAARGGAATRRFAGMTLAVSAVVFAFFVWKTNNYGGFTSGPRWLFWLTPLWLLGTLPAADRLGRIRGGRLVAAGLLGMSVLSAFYPAWNPWRPPWILQMCERYGWVNY